MSTIVDIRRLKVNNGARVRTYEMQKAVAQGRPKTKFVLQIFVQDVSQRCLYRKSSEHVCHVPDTGCSVILLRIDPQGKLCTRS